LKNRNVSFTFILLGWRGIHTRSL